jgi:hypothetical protein
MTWALSASGTQTATIGTEHTLATDTNNGTFYFEVDTNALALGDMLELRLYVMTLSGGTLRQVWKATYGPTVDFIPIAASPPQPSDVSCRVTLKQSVGTGRSFPWKLLRI